MGIICIFIDLSLNAQLVIFFLLFVIILFALIVFFKTIRIVPQKSAFIVERLGKYQATLVAGLHVLVPFINKVSYKHTLKEHAVDVPPQMCITRDNIAVEVDGILYMQVVDPKKASYGISNYRFASTEHQGCHGKANEGKLAKTNNSIIIPSDLADIAGMIKATSSVIKEQSKKVGE